MKIQEIIQKIKEYAIQIKQNIIVLYFAYKNPLLSVLPKLLILITIGYALSPIDLIPDFIPILGYLDDLIILPLLITISIKLIPENIIEKSKIEAENNELHLQKIGSLL